MFSTAMWISAKGMKILLVLMIFCDINFSTAGYLRTSHEDIPKKPISRKNVPHHRYDSEINSRYTLPYIRNHLHFNGERNYLQSHRLSLPHHHRQLNGRRESQVIHRGHLPPKYEQDPEHPEHSNYRQNVHERTPGMSRSSHYDSYMNRNSNHFSVSQRLKKSRNSQVLSRSNSRSGSLAQMKRDEYFVRPKFNDSRKLLRHAIGEEIDNITSAFKTGPKLKENKRDLTKTKSTSSRTKRLYQSLARFDLLYIFGLFLIFVPVASFAVVILPIISLCLGTCKKGKKKGGKGNMSSNDITIETALVNDSPDENTKHATESKSHTNLFRNFVSNEIDGEGDTVAKRMKLERWIMQGSNPKPKPHPKYHRLISSADVDSVKEEPSDIETVLGSISQKGDVSDETEDDEQVQTSDELPELPQGKFQNRMGRMIGNNRATKQESHPFSITDKTVTVGRVQDNRTLNPRNIFSMHHQSRRIPKRSAYSMVDIIPGHLSRI